MIGQQILQNLDRLGIRLGQQGQQHEVRRQHALMQRHHLRNRDIQGLKNLLSTFLDVVLEQVGYPM